MSVLKFKDQNIIKNTSLSTNFMAREFSCKHCGEVVVDTNMVENLQNLRTSLGVPIYITSAYRCLTHNRNVGSKDTSTHVSGQAVDFYLQYKRNGYQVFLEATKYFNGVGFYQSGVNPKNSYIHVDTRSEKLYWLSWLQKSQSRSKRVYIYFQNLDNMYAYMKKDTKIDWFNLVI
ncbi:MAG TPA: D-Ala-D-Ala carboxypeptidase family metallohydrolase [Bacilli bacterium]|nr:D-Ala-D-Ala carboxypeptidase family metallohydrolase [Bacilli bacterium]HQQ39688.1 D-Ala-D-Ala carboxypeptidase family metallohydrolase [Bacilli bacterium]